MAGFVVVFLAGLWLVAAPFLVGYQPRGAHWTPATRNDVIVGAVVAAVAFAAFFAALAGIVRDLYRRPGSRPDTPPPTT